MERTSAVASWCQWTVETARRYNLYPMRFVLSLPLVKDETVSRTKRTELSSFSDHRPSSASPWTANSVCVGAVTSQCRFVSV